MLNAMLKEVSRCKRGVQDRSHGLRHLSTIGINVLISKEFLIYDCNRIETLWIRIATTNAAP